MLFCRQVRLRWCAPYLSFVFLGFDHASPQTPVSISSPGLYVLVMTIIFIRRDTIAPLLQ